MGGGGRMTTKRSKTTQGQSLKIVKAKRRDAAHLADADEELASVGPRAGVGHAENARAGVLEGEVFVLELGAVDGRPARAVPVLEVASLRGGGGSVKVQR